MKILVIDNGTRYRRKLLALFGGHSVKSIKRYRLAPSTINQFDAIILSGGHSFSVEGHKNRYKKELALIRSATKPILGICLGFELIVVALGGKLKKITKKKGLMRIEIVNKDPIFRGIKALRVYEAHSWVTEKVPKVLVPLAKSKNGIEAIKVRNKNIYGLQFHPEVLAKKTFGAQIVKNFINLITGNKRS